MKNKPHSHRQSNTFRFRGFHEKVKGIRISTRDYLLKKLRKEHDDETLLWETTRNLLEENVTALFQEFQTSLGTEYQSLAQLLLHEDSVAAIIRDHLERADSLSLDPILLSLRAFARDTETNFYQKRFYEFVPLLVDLISQNVKGKADKDVAENIENLFVCCMALFSIFQSHLKDDFKKLYITYEYCTLLGGQYPNYINELAAQSLYPLFRSAVNEDSLKMCLKRVNKHDDETDGVGKLLFYTMKADVARRLHSSSSTIFSLLIKLIIDKKGKRPQAEKAILLCLNLLMKHVTSRADVPESWQSSWKKDSSAIWDVLLDRQKFVSSKTNQDCVNFVLRIIFAITDFRQAQLVTDTQELYEFLTYLVKLEISDEAGGLVAKIAGNLLCAMEDEEPSSDVIQSFLKVFFGANFSSFVIFNFVDVVVTSQVFDKEIMPSYLRFVILTLDKNNDQDIGKDIVNSIFKIVNANVAPVRTMEDIELWTKFELNFQDPNDDMSDAKLPSRLLETILSTGLDSKLLNMETVIKACICLPHISPLKVENFVPYLFSIMNDVFELMEKEGPKPLILEEPPKKKKKLHNPFKLNQNISVELREKSRKLTFLLSVLTETLYHIIPRDDFITSFSELRLISLLKDRACYRENVHFLKALDIHLSVLAMEDDEYMNENSLEIIFELLAPSLASHKPLVRLLVTHIFSLFPYERVPSHLPESRLRNFFNVMFEVEGEVFSPLDCKERLRLLSRLDINNENISRPASPLYQQAPLLFLIGQLHINFKDVWSPVLQLIAQYSYSMPLEHFWPVWLDKLKLASYYALGSLCNKSIEEEDATSFEDETLGGYHSDLISHPGFAQLNMKPNYRNFRDLLWQAMHQFPDICERNHNDVVALFFKFLEDELFPVDYTLAPTQDVSMREDEMIADEDKQNSDDERDDKDDAKVTKKTLVKLSRGGRDDAGNDDFNNTFDEISVVGKEESSDKNDDGLDRQSGESDEDEPSEKSLTSAGDTAVDPTQRVRKAPTKSLCEHLILFAKFRNPRVMMKTKELEERFCEFLSHPDAKVQKMTLDAIMAYRHKFLLPYKESLYNILDDKTFKNEIALFDIEGKGEDEAKSLKQEHRTDFMPYLMRILYGKMLYKTGNRTSGKVNIVVRKGIVLRFLAGANDSELDTFLNLSFDIFLGHLNGTTLDVVERVCETLDPMKVVPLKRMQGALGTLDSIFDKIGSLLVNKRQFLLKIILFILSSSVSLLENRKGVCNYYFPILKNIRQTSMKMVVMFFTNFTDYKWADDELEAVFAACVWPSLPKLPYEGIYSPTSLLRLFMCWSCNPAFHVLLSRHQKGNVDLTPMPFMIKLINHPKCHAPVVDFVFELIEKLLMEYKKSSSEEEGIDMEEEFEPFELPLNHILPLDQYVKTVGLSLTWGESIVWSSLDELILHMKNYLQYLRKDETVNKRKLKIVIRVAKWITKEEDAKELLNCIVMLLKKICEKQSDKAIYLLQVCRNLLDIAGSGSEYIDDFLPMFSVLNDRKCRLTLCEVMETLFGGQGNMAKSSEGNLVAKCSEGNLVTIGGEGNMAKWSEGNLVAKCSEGNLVTIGGEGNMAKWSEGNLVAKWSADLNSYSGEMVDEVDAERRLNCFREVNTYLKETNDLDKNLILFLVHHNMWVLTQAGSQGLNDLSILSLQMLIDVLVRLREKSPTLVKNILAKHFLPLVKSGLKSKNEVCRDSVMNILGTAVHKCHSFNGRLKDLFQLADVSDPDADFFLNMHHIQLSRRAKALSRVVSSVQDGKVTLQTDTITEFILPAATTYLFKDEYVKEPNLLTSCVTCIGVMARQLPWYQYQKLLDYYLGLLSRELKHLKLGVRVLEAVIDAFHVELKDFDPETERESVDVSVEGKEKEDGDEELDIEGDVKNTSRYSTDISKREKVYVILTTKFIPRIQKVLSAASARDREHKVNKMNYADDNDIKKIPLALALVKLLKKLPDKVLKTHINNVLVKLVGYLKSKLDSVRREARDMLVKVMKELGGKFLSFLINDLKDILTRGYDHHVLVFTVHAILIALQGSLEAHHVSPCVTDIMEICLEDIFGDKSEEKEITKMIRKVKETRAEKGFAVMGLIAHVIPVEQIENIMGPLKEKLQTHDFKVMYKIARCLQKLGVGLERNPNISLEQKSMFVYSLLNEKLSGLSNSKLESKNKPERSIRPDSFLIPPEPKRESMVPKTDRKTTMHVLVEFALRLLSDLLKHKHFSTTNDHCSLLDAYVGLMSNCLLSAYPEVSIQALHAISHLVQFPLPSLKENISNIVGKMYVILDKFSTSERKNKYFNLVQLDFKVMAVIIKEVTFYKLKGEHARVLINYASNLLNERNHACFILLNAFVARKLSYPELHDLMPRLREESIESTNINILDQARRTYLNYYHNYQRKKGSCQDDFIYYLKNIKYELGTGRMSAILAVQELIGTDVTSKLDQDTEIEVVSYVIDELCKATEHKSLLKDIIKNLYKKSCRKNVLIDTCVAAIKRDLESGSSFGMAIHVGIQGLLPMIDVHNGDQAVSIFDKIFPVLTELLHPDRFLKGELLNDCNDEAQWLDPGLNSLLQLLLVMMDFHLNRKDLPQWAENVTGDLWKHVQHFLLYPNLKVQLKAAAVFSTLFGAYPAKEDAVPVVAANAVMVEALVTDFCSQFLNVAPDDDAVLKELGLSVVSNLVYLVNQGRKVPIVIQSDDKSSKNSNKAKIYFKEKTNREPEVNEFLEGAHRVLEMMGVLAYSEIKTRLEQGLLNSTYRRESFLNLIAAVVSILREDLDKAPNIISFVMRHLIRELSDASLPEGLMTHTKNIADFVKEKIGVQTYNEETVKVQCKLDEKRTKRKAREHELYMINPEIAMKKKAKKNTVNKEAMKRKFMELKLRPNKKRRLKSFAIVRA